MKRCPACGLTKPADAFLRRWPDRPTLRSYCRDCESGRYVNPAGVARWHARNPERTMLSVKACRKVAYAIRKGRLTRPAACEWCGRSDKRIEAAHFDYSQPLNVRWLCPPCHRAWDAKEPKTLAA